MSDRHEAPLTEVAVSGWASAAFRLLLGALIGAAGGVTAALVIVHQAEKRGWAGNINLARGVGLARGAGGTDAAREGLYTLFIAGTLLGLVVLAIALALGERRLAVLTPITAVAGFLAWGLVCSPFINSRVEEYTPGGAFGGGFQMSLIYAVAAAVYGFVAARLATVIRDADFWVAKDNDIRAGLEHLQEMGLVGPTGAASLELAEERAEQGGEPTGGQAGDRRS